MNIETNGKVTAEHLGRDAYLYVRQSTPKQVIENIESTKRQYGLKSRALTLGWDESRIHVIDSDQGQSGASQERDGFRYLVSEVGLGRAGIVMGLEVSRLARNSIDWHRLLEICALTGTLILDEEGVYDPAHFNDRLLLGLKGTMSEAELHIIRSRLQGGMRAKARRGELKLRLPIGFVHDLHNRIVLDPNSRIQESVRLLFDVFRRVGTACRVVREFNKRSLLFPSQVFSGPQKGEIIFQPLTFSRAMQVLKNPRYAGVYAYGMRVQCFAGENRKPRVKYLPRERWQAFIKEAHDGYLSWQEYEENLRRLRENCEKASLAKKGAPREGPALLQGLAVCGVCGCRMSVRYHSRRGNERSPDYLCAGKEKHLLRPYCQTISGQGIDELIASILVDRMRPAALEVTLGVQDELRARFEEADNLRHKHVEQAQYEMECAKRRYMAIDPHNRLVADALEADWNQAIRAYREAQDVYERQRAQDQGVISQEQRQKIIALCADFDKLFKSNSTTDRDRKRMVRLLIEDVTLTKSQKILVQIRFKGGMHETHELSLPKAAFEECKHSPEVISEIDNLLDEHSDSQVAEILNQKGLLSGTGKSFDSRRVSIIRRTYNLRSYFYRLREQGFSTLKELSQRHNVQRTTIYRWRKQGRFKAVRYDDVGRYLYQPLSESNTMNIGGAV